MEQASVKLNDPELFDKLLKEGLPEGGDLLMVTKDDGTVQHRPAVLLTFTVQLPDGSLKRVQTVTTGRLFALMAAAFRGRYGINGDMVCTADKVN